MNPENYEPTCLLCQTSSYFHLEHTVQHIHGLCSKAWWTTRLAKNRFDNEKRDAVDWPRMLERRIRLRSCEEEKLDATGYLFSHQSKKLTSSNGRSCVKLRPGWVEPTAEGHKLQQRAPNGTVPQLTLTRPENAYHALFERPNIPCCHFRSDYTTSTSTCEAGLVNYTVSAVAS